MIKRSRLLYSAPVPDHTKSLEINKTSTEQIASEPLSKPVVINVQKQDPKDQTLEILQKTFSVITFRAKKRIHS